MRRLHQPIVLLALVTALAVAAPSAAADGGPSPGVSLGWDGVAAAGGSVRYVTLGARRGTVLARVRVHGGRVLGYRALRGAYGVPLVAWDGSAGGLSADRRVLALAQVSRALFAPVSRFLVLDARRLRVRHAVTLPGAFTFDALSPDGRVLFLVQHLSAEHPTRYVVRAYDLEGGYLYPARIADSRERWETSMQGMPMTRTASADGRWVYTLYTNPEEYAFIHALDTVRREAVCIDLPWRRHQAGVSRLRFRFARGGEALQLVGRHGRRAAIVDLETLAVDAARRPNGHI